MARVEEREGGATRRGINGVYHNVSREHLHRYCDQYAFLYNIRGLTDGARTLALNDRSEDKRLMYRESRKSA